MTDFNALGEWLPEDTKQLERRQETPLINIRPGAIIELWEDEPYQLKDPAFEKFFGQAIPEGETSRGKAWFEETFGKAVIDPNKGKSLDVSVTSETLMKLQQHPNMYAALGAIYETVDEIERFTIGLIPWYKYRLPEEREAYDKLDTRHQTRALLIEDLMFSALFTKGGQVVMNLPFKAAGRLIKLPFNVAGKVYKVIKPTPKIKPIEDIVSWTTTSYEESLGKFLRKKRFSKIESDAIFSAIHGDEEAIKNALVQSRLIGSKESNVFNKVLEKSVEGKGLKYLSERKGIDFRLKEEFLKTINPETVRKDKVIKEFTKAVSSPGVLGREAYGKGFKTRVEVAYKAEAKRFFGERAAEEMTMKNSSDELFINFMEDMLKNPKAVKRTLQTPAFSALAPIKIVAGKGEMLGLKTRSLIHQPLVEATRRMRGFSSSMVGVFQQMLEQRGFGKIVVKRNQIAFKDAVGITASTRERAAKVMKEAQVILGEAENIKTPEAFKAARQKISTLINPKDPDAKIVTGLVDTTYDFFDTLYGIDVYETLSREFARVGLSKSGRAAFEKKLSQEMPKVQRLFSTGAGYSYTQKQRAMGEILNRFKEAIPGTFKGKNNWFSVSGKKLETRLNELNKQLTFQGKEGKFIEYRSNYLPRIAAEGRQLETKVFNALKSKMSPFYTKQIKAEMPKELIGLEELVVARVNAQAKRTYLYEPLGEVSEYASTLAQNWKDYTEHTIARLLGVPSKADAWLAKTIDTVWLGKQGWDARRVMRLTKNVNDLAYMGFLGLRPFSALRNLFQPWLLLPADLGGIKDYGTLVQGVSKVYGKGGAAVRKEIRAMGIITEFAPETFRKPQLFGGTGKKLVGKVNAPSMEATRDVMSILFRGADISNRYISASSAMVKWDKALGKFGGKVTEQNLERFMQMAGVEGRHPWIRREIVDKVQMGWMGDARKQFVADVVGDTQFLYSILESPLIGQTLGGVGRTAAIFQSWWMNYGALLHKWMLTGKSPSHWMGADGAKAERMFTFVLSSYTGYKVMEQMWGSDTAMRSTFLGPFPDPSRGLQLPPAWQVPAKAFGMIFAAAEVMATGKTDQLGKQGMALLDSVTNFIPGGVFSKSIIKGIKKETQGEKGALIRAPFKFRDFSKPLRK